MDNNEILAKVIAVVGDTFSADTASLNADSVSADVDGWDSVSHAMVVMNIEDAFGIELDIAETMAAENLGALSAMIQAKIADA